MLEEREQEVDYDDQETDLALNSKHIDGDKFVNAVIYVVCLFSGFTFGIVASDLRLSEPENIVKTERMRLYLSDALQIADNTFVVHVQNELGKKAIADLRKAFEAEHPDLTVDSIEKEPVYSAHKGVYSRVSGVAYKIQTSKS